MNIDLLPKKLPDWLKTGNPLRALFFSKVKFVRNIIGFSFPGKSNNDSKLEVRELILKAIENTLTSFDLHIFNLEELTKIHRAILVERRIIPEHFADGNLIGNSVAISDDESISIYINDENHLTIQVLMSEDMLQDAYNKAFEIVTRLSEDLDFAFDSKLGFLTARLTETGLGAHFSHFFHIPVLEIERQTQHIGKGADEVNCNFVRDGHHTKTGVEGFYCLTNANTLGITENKIIEQMTSFSRRIVDYEKKMQGVAYIDNKDLYEDKGFRALGMLQSARMISFQECVRMISDLRTAMILKFLDRNIDPILLLKLLYQIFPAHLSIILDKTSETAKTKTTMLRNIEKSRAELIRDIF
ncbi:MAG: hypothetical protein K8S87_03665 [Planctomycetes bacterium]|nr:hypothetical protein [Planctomycetota bacterium]